MELKSVVLQLTALRESRGVSLATIAERTKISRYYLQAIEDLDFDKLPGGVYRDNFLKQYASAIDSDIAEDVSNRLQQQAREAREAEEKALANNSLARHIKENVIRGAAVLFLLSPAVSGQNKAPASASVRNDDPRLQSLKKFFGQRDCPIGESSADFISAADRNGLDWRLLPSIAFLESSGGKHLINMNPLGWGSGKTQFRSLAASIHHVAERLSNSPIYAGKDLRAKLRIYNPARKDYATRVMEVMEQLAPSMVAASR